MAKTNLTFGSPWANHRQSKVDFWPFCGNYPGVTEKTWGLLLGLIDSLGTVLKDGGKKIGKKKKMIFLCIFQVWTHKRDKWTHGNTKTFFLERQAHPKPGS